MSESTGKFVWYDLMTTDPTAAQAFYTEVIGWKTEPWEGPNPYTLFAVGDRGSLGGVAELPEQAREMGAPPHWLSYVEVKDVDATVERAKELGASVMGEPFDIPGVGRIAILRDPQGAVLGTFKPEKPAGDDWPMAGDACFGWNELNTTDWKAARDFYTRLFGWTETETLDMGEMGVYWMYGRGDQSYGGMCNAAAAMEAPPHWMYYVQVTGLDAAAERVKSNGGKILNGPMEVPGGDRVVQCMDPQGAAFGMFEKGTQQS
jgi:predicted enzyme related to lactoylglutathione lyase